MYFELFTGWFNSCFMKSWVFDVLIILSYLHTTRGSTFIYSYIWLHDLTEKGLFTKTKREDLISTIY